MNRSAETALESNVMEAESLPVWDLGGLYSGPGGRDIIQALDRARDQAEAFRAAYIGRVARLDGASLGQAIADYETLSDLLHKVMAYAQLRFASDMSDGGNGRFLQTVRERFNAIAARTLFFTLEINRIDEGALTSKMETPEAARYWPWVRDLRVFRDHQLSDDLEELLHEKEVTGAAAWTRLFDQTMAELRFPVHDRELTLAETLNRLVHADRAERRAAAKALGGVLDRNIDLFALITNTLAKDKEIEDKWRRYPSPISQRNKANAVEDSVVDALVESIRATYDQMAHRYYRLKAEWFGEETLAYWDRSAPLPGRAERTYTWDEARTTVLDAFARFDPMLAEIGARFFDQGWIDAEPRPGKDSGAFCHPAVPSHHPYILMNFYGRPRDVTTLAHELGHGVQQVLAAKQGALMAETPLTLAETASVFGEMLVFRALVDDETDPARRKRLLAGKVEDMLNTVVRQIAFHDFEHRVHLERRNEELSPEQLGEIWLTVQRESLGPALRFEDEYRHFWAYIPHFVHSPFYVYAYAFGDCLVNSLYQVYSEGHDGFQQKFRGMLEAGGTLRHKDLLRPFGLDASDPQFWRRGINIVVGLIDELEGLD